MGAVAIEPTTSWPCGEFYAADTIAQIRLYPSCFRSKFQILFMVFRRPRSHRHRRLEVSHPVEALQPRNPNCPLVLGDPGRIFRGNEGKAASVRHRKFKGSKPGGVIRSDSISGIRRGPYWLVESKEDVPFSDLIFYSNRAYVLRLLGPSQRSWESTFMLWLFSSKTKMHLLGRPD